MDEPTVVDSNVVPLKRHAHATDTRDPAKLCKAHKVNGEPCKAYAIKGGTVCRRHGGSAPQVRAKALERLHAAADWLMERLLEIAKSAENETVRLAAIKDALDRAGFSAAQVHKIAVLSDSVWGGGFEGVKWISVAEDDESAEAEANLHATTQLQVEAGHDDDDVDELLPGVVEAELVEDDDPWAPATTTRVTDRQRTDAYEAELRERQKPLRSRRRR